MNTPTLTPRNNEEIIQDHFATVGDETPQVAHATIPGFLRKLNHRWSMIDIERFGAKVGRTAETMHLAYMPAFDRSLGVLRSFPVPMMERIYEILAPAHGWPALPVPVQEAPDIREQRAALKVQEVMVKQLGMLSQAAEDGHVRRAAAVVLDLVERKRVSLEAELTRALESAGLADGDVGTGVA